MNNVKNYDVGITRLDDTYKHFVHELPLLSFGDARNAFALSLVFQSKLTSNPFYIANGYKLNIQKRIIFSDGYPQSYEDGDGKSVQLNRFGNKYSFDDGSQRIIRLINGQYILENPDYSTEVFDTSGNILSTKDKYGNTLLSYTYTSSMLTSVSYKNQKTVTFGYSNNTMQYIRYAYSNSIFETTLAYSNNSMVVNHYSGVNYHLKVGKKDDNDNSSSTLRIYSTNLGEEFSNEYSNEIIAEKNEYGVTIKKSIGNKTIDETNYLIVDCDGFGNVKKLDVVDFKGVSTRVQFENGKPAYSYENLDEMFAPRPDTEDYCFYPGKVTFYNNEKAVGYQYYDDGIVMSRSTATSVNSYYLQYALSGMMMVSGWIKPLGETSDCTIIISGSHEEIKATHSFTGLREGEWSYFSVSFYMENDIVVHVRTDKEASVIETRDFRLSAQGYSAEPYSGHKDNLTKSFGVLIHKDSNQVEHYIPMNESVTFLNHGIPINQSGRPITVSDIIRYKINKMLGKNTEEIYYNEGRGVFLLSNNFSIEYSTSENIKIRANINDCAVGRMFSSNNNVYVTKSNTYVENGSLRFKTETLKNNVVIKSEIYDNHLDLIKSTVKGVTTTYIRNSNTGLIESQTTSNSQSSESISYSAVYDENDFLVSTTNEFGVTTTYTTDAIWGVVTQSAVTNGVTVTDVFNEDCSIKTSRRFSTNNNSRVTNLEYNNGFLTKISNGFLDTITDNSLNYTINYNLDYISSIAKNDQSVIQFKTEENMYGGEDIKEDHPIEGNSDYSLISAYDKYGRLVEIKGLITNTYNIAIVSAPDPAPINFKNSSAKLIASNDYITGRTTNYKYEKDRISQIENVDSSSAKINGEHFTYNNNGWLTSDKFEYDNNGHYLQNNIGYIMDDSHPAAGKIFCYSHSINDAAKATTENTYDAYARITSKKHTIGDKDFTKSIVYDKTRVRKITYTPGETTQYEYDSMGRLSYELDRGNSVIKGYSYDSYGQLVREDNKLLDKTYVYVYNNIGNITCVRTYNYTTGSLGNIISQQNFGYDTAQPDKLTSCGSMHLSYNTLGCPTLFDGYNATWTRGKLTRLTTGLSSSGIHNYYYNYNAKGQRTGRSYTYSIPISGTAAVASGMPTSSARTFHYDNSGRLVFEVNISTYYREGTAHENVFYLYDESGVIGMDYSINGGEASTYYFQRNLLGDVIGIYDTNGNKVAGYAYDAWGKCVITNDTTLPDIAHANSFRYRGYYYDEDTGLYYLNSRYYNPKWHRFISPDDTAYLDPESVNGLNLYCYCNNDPVNYIQRPVSSGGSLISSSISAGGSSVSAGGASGGGNLGGAGNPTAPWWASTAVGAIPDFILGMKYLAASGMHSKFAYATNTRYMHPIMGGTWRWFGKSSSSFGTVAQGTFKQMLTGDARAGFGAVAKSVGGVVGLNALVNFGFNLYENNWQVDSTMLVDTAIDTAIGVGSYYLAAGATSLATAGLLAAGVALPGIIVVGGVVILSIGFEHVIRAISGYWD